MAVPSIPATPIHGLPTAAQPPAPSPEPAVSVTPAANSGRPSAHGHTRGDAGSAGQAMSQALQDLNEHMQAWSTHLQFDIDPEVKRVVISVLDARTGEVLRTIPSDTVMHIARTLIHLQGQAIAATA